MKKICVLLLLTYCCNTLWAQRDDGLTRINEESIELNTAKTTSRLLALYNFPPGYEEVLRPQVADLESQKAAAKHKYSESEIKGEIYRLTAEFEIWLASEIAFVDKANILWETTVMKHALAPKYKKAFVNYHFYLNRLSKDNDAFSSAQLDQLSQSPALIEVSQTIARKETARVIAKCSAVQGLDPASIDYANEKLGVHLQSMTAATLSSKSEIVLIRDSDTYCDYAYKKGLIKKQEVDRAQFMERATAAGLDAETTTAVLSLIETRANELETLKDQKRAAKAMAQLFESTDLKTKTEIKREFGRNLAKTIDEKQFSALFGDVFMENVNQQTSAKIAELQNTFALNTTQLEEITKVVETYYFDKEITAAYYGYDKKLRKQKVSALSYKFGRTYKELMQNFDLEVNSGAKVNNRTYLWNN